MTQSVTASNLASRSLGTREAVSVSSAVLSGSVHAVVDAGAVGARGVAAVVRGEAEAIGLLRVLVECSRGFLSDFEAESLGTRGGEGAFECAEAFVSARGRAGRLLQSWSLPEGGKVVSLRKYSYAQLREVARLHAEGLSVSAIAKRVGMTHWSVLHHLGPSGSMLAAMLDGDLSLLIGEGLVGRSSPNGSEGAAGPLGVARARAQRAEGGVA